MDDGRTLDSTATIEELIASITALSEEYGEEVAEAIRAAREQPLDAERARRLYTRILAILRDADGGSADGDGSGLAEEIAREVGAIVDSVERPTPLAADDFFVEHEGLAPREVLPTPMFNEKPIGMTEGYVDVERLKLWKDNHRLSLHIQEFRERNSGQAPDEAELIALMQGAINLPSVDRADPFKLKPLADSIARKGVETPPIVSFEGEPKDGNRRIAASLLVIYGKDYDAAQKQRARYIRVWRAPQNTTDDQFEAIVVSRNFERDYKEPWPEYIKGKLVVDEFELRKRELKGRITKAALKKVRDGVARDFAIKPGEVKRYDEMIRWAEDFSAYHHEQNRDPAEVRYKTEKNFQWFYELDAGRGDEKLTRKLDADDELKAVVYDLMFDVLGIGAQVRELRRVVSYPETSQMLLKAHELIGTNPEAAEELVDEAIVEAKRRSVKRRSIGFDDYLKGMVERLGAAPPDQWSQVDTELLLDVRRVLLSTLGSIEGQATVRREHGEEIEEIEA